MFSPEDLKKPNNGSNRQSEFLIHRRYPELLDTVKEILSQSAEPEHICRLLDLTLGKCTLFTRLIYLNICLYALMSHFLPLFEMTV